MTLHEFVENILRCCPETLGGFVFVMPTNLAFWKPKQKKTGIVATGFCFGGYPPGPGHQLAEVEVAAECAQGLGEGCVRRVAIVTEGDQLLVRKRSWSGGQNTAFFKGFAASRDGDGARNPKGMTGIIRRR